MHHLLIGGMVSFGYRDRFHMMSVLVCDAHWTRPMMNHDTRLSIVMIHQATWTLNLERILRLCQNQQKVLTYG